MLLKTTFHAHPSVAQLKRDAVAELQVHYAGFPRSPERGSIEA